MEMPKFTVLSSGQCYGSHALNLFDKIDLTSEVTDFVNYICGLPSYIKNDNKKLGYYWTKDKYRDNAIIVIGNNKKLKFDPTSLNVGIRLAIKFSSIEKYCSNNKAIIQNEVFQFEFGKYIQSIVDPNINIILNNHGKILMEKTEHKYKINIQNNGSEFIYLNSYKYFCDKKEYIKIRTDYLCTLDQNIIENYNTEYIWFCIEPIKWLRAINDEYAITEKIISAGIPFNNFETFENPFNSSYIKQYIDDQLTKEIVQSYKIFGNTNSCINNTVMSNEAVFNEKITATKSAYVPVHLNNKKNYYGVYLTDNEYITNPAVGREQEIRNLEKKLLIPKTGVVLVGEAGVGKTAIVEGLAYQIQNGNVCDLLKNKGILNVNVSELLAGCKYRGDFEEKVTNLCKDLLESKNIILFLDEIHMSLGAGSADTSNIDMANMLKTYISNDQIKVIGCTTKAEYENYFVNDKAYRRRFKIVDVKEPDTITLNNIMHTTIKILSNKFHIKLKLTESENEKIIDTIIKLSVRKQKYMYENLKNPDSSINILTECFAYFAVENIKEAQYQDFINGIIDNDNLSLSKMEIENWLKNDVYNNEDTHISNRQKIFTLNRKGN